MNSSVFSADEIADSFWSSAVQERPTATVSDWAYDKFLEEVTCPSVISPTVPLLASNSKQTQGGKELNKKKVDQSSTAPIRTDDYHAFLKSQLDQACAAVARSRGSTSKPGEFSALPMNIPHSIRSLQLESTEDGSGLGISTTQCASDGASPGNSALPSVQKNPVLHVKQTTSESSREDSDDDELEVDTGTTENLDPAEVKRVRRMQSNRESARRSRRRKQEHMNELETQVGQLKVEHTTLLKRLTDINHKYDEASVDNRILKADIETLRAKVKMAEETVKQVTGINPLLLAMSNVHNTGIPFMSSPMDSLSIPPMPMQPNPNHLYFNHSVAPSTIPGMTHPQRLDSGFSNGTNSNFLPQPVHNLQNEGETGNMHNIGGPMS
ncbi:hypothetical protein SAY86_008867 [Trapa natans]|uniref:BZIP domain-containing protein n=1 Tax=Trapa natans TaxID=22666 RepID=A0AAN7QBU9_TRANT|nr:hypothetical protein SAY86_008867 [Trapa natans]